MTQQQNNAAQENNKEITLATFEFYLNSNNDLCYRASGTPALDKAEVEQIFPQRLCAIIGNKIILALQKNFIKALEAQNGTNTGSL